MLLRDPKHVNHLACLIAKVLQQGHFLQKNMLQTDSWPDSLYKGLACFLGRWHAPARPDIDLHELANSCTCVSLCMSCGQVLVATGRVCKVQLVHVLLNLAHLVEVPHFYMVSISLTSIE